MSVKNLNDEKLLFYEKILKEEKKQTQEILNKINELQRKGNRDLNGDSSAYMIHQADMGSDTDESEKRVYYLNKEMEKLKQINIALHRIYEKSYGICEICGEYIPEKRLEIIPYAKYCIACKSAEENKKKKHR